MKDGQALSPSLILLCCALLGSGCVSPGELHLWPLFDLDRPYGGQHRYQLQLLWPLVNVDTTGEKASHAVRPLYSYDGNTRSGTVLLPLLWYRWNSPEYLHLAPIYWSTRGPAQGDYFTHLWPLVGSWRQGNDEGWLAAGGWFFHMESATERLDGMAVPPMFYQRSKDKDAYRYLALNYYRSHTPYSDAYTLFPLLWWETSGKAGKSYRRRELFPLFSVEEQQGDYRRTRLLWPLVSWEQRADGYDHHLLAYLINWGKSSDSRYSTVLPFYGHSRSPERETLLIPPLLFYRSAWQQSRGMSGQEGYWWPWVGWRRRFDAAEDGSQRVFEDRVSFLSGVVRYTRYPFQNGWEISPLWPLVQLRHFPEQTHHRLWPLYRYDAYARPRNEQHIHALAELVAIRHAERMSGDLSFLLRPFTYQSTPGGDYELRVLWKLFEARRQGPATRWGLNPLFYFRRDPQSERKLFLGGLVGYGRDQEQRFLRLFWFIDLPL